MIGATRSFLEDELRPKRRHWSPTSQVYVSADILLQYLHEGWKISPLVSIEQYGRPGKWRAQVYYFELIRGSQSMILPVYSNPVVRRLLAQESMIIH
jgi:hypothetical protein